MITPPGFSGSELVLRMGDSPCYNWECSGHPGRVGPPAEGVSSSTLISSPSQLEG